MDKGNVTSSNRGDEYQHRSNVDTRHERINSYLWDEGKGTIGELCVPPTPSYLVLSTHTQCYSHLTHFNGTVSIPRTKRYCFHRQRVNWPSTTITLWLIFCFFSFLQSHLLDFKHDSLTYNINLTSTLLFSLSFSIRQGSIIKTSLQLLRKDKLWHLWPIQFISTHKEHSSSLPPPTHTPLFEQASVRREQQRLTNMVLE